MGTNIGEQCSCRDHRIRPERPRPHLSQIVWIRSKRYHPRPFTRERCNELICTAGVDVHDSDRHRFSGRQPERLIPERSELPNEERSNGVGTQQADTRSHDILAGFHSPSR